MTEADINHLGDGTSPETLAVTGAGSAHLATKTAGAVEVVHGTIKVRDFTQLLAAVEQRKANPNLGIDARDAVLIDPREPSSSLMFADLHGADFSGCIIAADCSYTNLEGANFTGAVTDEMVIDRSTRLTGAIFSGEGTVMRGDEATGSDGETLIPSRPLSYRELVATHGIVLREFRDDALSV